MKENYYECTRTHMHICVKWSASGCPTHMAYTWSTYTHITFGSRARFILSRRRNRNRNRKRISYDWKLLISMYVICPNGTARICPHRPYKSSYVNIYRVACACPCHALAIKPMSRQWRYKNRWRVSTPYIGLLHALQYLYLALHSRQSRQPTAVHVMKGEINAAHDEHIGQKSVKFDVNN